MKVLLIGNYAPDQQHSMLGFVQALHAGLCERGVDARILAPQSVAGRLGIPKMGKWLGYIDKLAIFPRTLQRAMAWADVVHICDQGNAFYTRYLAKKPHLLTCHDLLAVRSAQGELADWKTKVSGRMYQRLILNGVKRAGWIACVSETTQQDILRLAHADADHTCVIYNGFYRKYERMKQEQCNALFTDAAIPLNKPFALHIGGNQPYKNRKAVLSIYRELLALPAGNGLSLIMAGKPFTPEMRGYVNVHGLSDTVRELTNADDNLIRALYSRASALIFPSLYEGFGLPIIEAQASGCPVFTSGRAPMTEVGGDAAVYFDPTQPKQAAQIIASNLETTDWMVAAGLENVKRFATDKMVDGYVQTYQRVMSGTE